MQVNIFLRLKRLKTSCSWPLLYQQSRHDQMISILRVIVLSLNKILVIFIFTKVWYCFLLTSSRGNLCCQCRRNSRRSSRDERSYSRSFSRYRGRYWWGVDFCRVRCCGMWKGWDIVWESRSSRRCRCC